MKRLAAFLADVLWPRKVKCLCCDERSEGQFLCVDCQRELDALRLDDPLAAWRYAGCARTLVAGLKYEGVADCAEVLAQGIAGTIRTLELPPSTVLTWVTMPEKRLRERGVDHGRLLCEAVGRAAGMPVSQLLGRRKAVHTQRGLGREARLHNLRGTVFCSGSITTPVLLIDDVMTTGATVQACSDALKEAGAPAVYAVAATRVILEN